MCEMSEEIEKIQYNWTDLETAYPCMALRSQIPIPGGLFWWCGYVAIPKGHPLLGIDLQNKKFPDLRSRGGITFTGFGDDGETWLVGFDCAHAGDLELGEGPIQTKASINLEYVKRQCSKLAAQLHALAPKKLLRSWLCWQLVPSEEPDVMDTTPSAFLPVGTELVRVHYLSRDGWCAQVWGDDGLGRVYYGTDSPFGPEIT